MFTRVLFYFVLRFFCSDLLFDTSIRHFYSALLFLGAHGAHWLPTNSQWLCSRSMDSASDEGSMGEASMKCRWRRGFNEAPMKKCRWGSTNEEAQMKKLQWRSSNEEAPMKKLQRRNTNEASMKRCRWGRIDANMGAQLTVTAVRSADSERWTAKSLTRHRAQDNIHVVASSDAI